jgi:hypothetical protein
MESYNWKAKPISPCLGAHEAHPKNYFVWGCFPKIELAPAYVDPGARPAGRGPSAARPRLAEAEKRMPEEKLDGNERWRRYDRAMPEQLPATLVSRGIG